MATEEEAREAEDGKEVQVEGVDLEPFHMQTKGTLKIPEDQILVDAHSEIKLLLEDNLNATSSSLNGYMHEENKVSNKQLHEDSKKDHEQAEATLDGESTDQDNKNDKEANDRTSHVETTPEDRSLLKHENEEGPKGDDQQDEDPMPDTLKTNSDIDESKLVVDQLDQNMDPGKAIKLIQPASMENISNAEDVTQACAEVQSHLYLNLDDSAAILHTVDGCTETDEVAREDSAIHLEHREGFPEGTSTTKCTEEVVKAENQQSKQANAMDADAVSEDIAKCVSEEMPKSDHADDSTIDARELLHQEPSKDTNGPACEKKEQTSQQSSMEASDDITSEHDSTTGEPPVDIQLQNKKSLQEVKDADSVDTEAAMQESCIAFEELIPEYNVATTEHDSVETNDTESAKTHDVKTVPSSEEDKVENGVAERGPTTGSQEVDNVESTEEIMNNIAENIVEVTNVATVDEVDKEKNMLRAEDIAEKHVQVIEPEVTKSTEPVETEKDSDQRHVSLLDDSAQGDNTPVSEKQDMESALEINEIEAKRTEAVPDESNASVSEEPSPEDYVTESETTSDAKELNTTAYLEAIECNKYTKTREMHKQDNMGSAGKSTQENNAPESELTSEIQPQQEPELEEMKATDLAQVNGSSPEISATIFYEKIQENNPTTSELHVMEPEAGVRNIEATKVQATPHQLNSDQSEEKVTEENIISSETQTLEPESVKKMNDIEATKPQDISQQRINSPSEKSVPEVIAKEDVVTIEPYDGHQQPHDPDCCVQPAQRVESSKDREDSTPLKEEASDQKMTPLEDTATEDIAEDEIDPLVGIEQEHQQKSVEISDVQEVQELDSTEQNRGIEATETEHHQQHRVSALEEPAVDNKQNVDDHRLHKEKPAELKAMEAEPVLEQSNISSPDNAPEEKSKLGNDPDCCVQPAQQVESSKDSEDSKLLKEDETSKQIIITLEDTATEDIVEDEIDTPDGMEQEHEQKSVETSDVQEVQELGPTEQTRGSKAMETEHHQQNIVSTLEEPAVDNKKNVDDHQVHEEKTAELKDNESNEAEQVLEQSNICSPDNAPGEKSELGNDPDCRVQAAQQVEPSRDGEDSKLLKQEETSDQTIITLEDTATEDIVQDEIDTPVGMEQEPEQKSVETSDVQEVQELSLAEQTIGIEATEIEDDQQHRDSTFEEPAVGSKQNVDDHQVHEDQTAELEDNESMEAEPVLEQSNVCSPENAPEEKSELGNDLDCCVQPAQQVEPSRDSEESKLSKEDETSGQTMITLEDTATEHIVEDEIDTPVGIEQELEHKSVETSNVQEVQELGPTEQTRGIKAMETEHHQQHIVSTLEEPAVDNKQNVDDHQVHKEQTAELKDNESMEDEPVLEQSNMCSPDNKSPDNTPEEKSELGNDPDCVQPAQQEEPSRDSEDSKLLKEEETSDQTIITLEHTATEDIVQDEIDTPVGMEQEHEQKTVETSDVQEVQELSLAEQTRGIEATETEDDQQHRVSTLEEPALDSKQNVDDHQVQEEKTAELKDNESMGAEQVLEQSNICSPDNTPEEKSELDNDPDCCVQPAQQVESSRYHEDSELLKKEETSDQTTITLEDTTTEHIVEDEIDTPVGMEQELEQKSVETSDVQEVQELGPTEQTRGIEAMETKHHQQRIVSTLEEPAVDNKQNLDDHQVHEEKTAELKDNESMEDEPVLEQSNICSPENTSEEKSELGNDPDCCVQQAQQVESSRDSEDSKLLKEEETSDQTIITLEDTATEDIVQDEIDTPVGMEQDHEQKSVETSDVQEVQELSRAEQTRGIEATETEDDQQQRVSTLEEPALDSKQNVDDHQVHEEKTAELKDIESMGAEPVLEQSNICSPDNTPEEKSELDNDPDCCVQPAQQVEPSRYSEDSELLKKEETSDQTTITLEDTASQDIVEDESDPPVGLKQEHEEKVSLDEQHEEDEEVESRKEQLQADEQKHEEEADDVGNEPLVESKNTETGTTNRTEGTDTLEAEQTEAVVNETVKIQQALHNSEDSTLSITGKDYSANTSEADAKMDKQEDQENTGKDNIVTMDSTNGQDETTDENTNDELETGLESSVQEISHISPSRDHILENDPIVITYNAESGGEEDKECKDKVNDNLLDIQESEKEMVAGMQENTEMQNETKGVHHAESYTKAEEEEMDQLRSDEPYNVDTKIDDTTHNKPVQPQECEEIGENKGLSSIHKPVAVVETSKQNNVEQDSSIHHKVEGEKLESTEDNDVELEATQEKVDTSNFDTNNDDQLSISNSFTEHETESADDVLQFETEGNICDKADEADSYEETEASNTSVRETVTFNEEICDKVTGTEGGLSDESLKTFDGTRRNLEDSSVVTESNVESINKEVEEHNFAAPTHPTMDENTSKQEISEPEKPLPTEPEEQEDDQIHKQQDEEGMHEPGFGNDQKEVEQDLPVSSFLMNLILGKENSDANGQSPEAETKQEKTTNDNICLIIDKQEESLVLSQTENNIEDKLVVEQEKKDVKCSNEKHEVVEEQSHDLMLGTETSLETDAEVNKNSHHLELPSYQDKMQDEISNEILSEAAEVFTKVEAKDIVIPHIKQDDREVDTVCQENTETATQSEIGSLKNNLDDLNSTKTSEEKTLGEGQAGPLPECLTDARSVNSVSEQTLLLTESGTTNAKSLSSEADSVPNPVCDIQDKTIECSSIGTTSIPDIQVESEEDKTEEKQPTTTGTGEVAEEHVEISNNNSQKSIGPEATSNEQESQIAEQASNTELALGHEKEISACSNSIFMDKKEDSNVPVKEGNNIQTAVEIQADGSNMQINGDKQEAADNKTGMESEKLQESSIQEKQGNGTEEKSSKECYEEDQNFLVKRDSVIKEGDVHETVKSHTETVKIKANDEQELSDLKIQERDLNVFSPKDVCEPKESFVDTAKPKFSTDEEQSPKADESNMSEQKTYEGKTKDEEKIENFTDRAMQTEAQVAGQQKAVLKKHNLLSGVGSKVKRQLAKVKNAITGKPGHTKAESPKA